MQKKRKYKGTINQIWQRVRITQLLEFRDIRLKGQPDSCWLQADPSRVSPCPTRTEKPQSFQTSLASGWSSTSIRKTTRPAARFRVSRLQRARTTSMLPASISSASVQTTQPPTRVSAQNLLLRSTCSLT